MAQEQRLPSETFCTEVLRVGDSVLIAVRGELDVATASRFREAVAGLADASSPPDITVDVSRLEFIDAAGVGVLVSLRNAVHRAGGILRVRSLRPPVRRVLELTEVVDFLGAGAPG